MEPQLYWIYAFNIILNSFLAFFTALVLIECILRCLKISNPRIKAVCRTLPYVKVCIDICLYNFSKWALYSGHNPLDAEINSRQFGIMVSPFTGIQFSMQDGKTFSMADIIALSIDPLWIKLVVITAACGTLFFFMMNLRRLLSEKKRVERIVGRAEPLYLK